MLEILKSLLFFAQQVSRGHFSHSTPIFLRRAKAQGMPKEIPLYLPHGQVREWAEYCLGRPGGEGLTNPRPPSPAEMASDGGPKAEAPPGDTRSTHSGPHPIVGKDRCLPEQELSARAGEDSGEGSTDPSWGEEDGSEPAEGKKLGLKKLLLSQEQKTRLLDWNDSNPEGLRRGAGVGLSQKSAENGRGGRVLKPVRPLLLPRAVRETLPAQTEAQEKTGSPVERTPGERSVAPPKSPLRLIANAIRRSLEPLLPNSEGGRKAWAKPESKALPTIQPPAFTRSFSLRRSSSSKDWDPQSPRRSMANRASAFFSLGTPTAKAAQPLDPGPAAPALRTCSLPNRPSRMFPALASPPCSKMEDVPTLLEKVSLQETLPDASRFPKRRIPVFASLRLKDKAFETFPQEPRHRKDLQDVSGSPTGKVPPAASAPPPEERGQPISSPRLRQTPRPPPGREAGEWLLPTRVCCACAAVSDPCWISKRASFTWFLFSN